MSSTVGRKELDGRSSIDRIGEEGCRHAEEFDSYGYLYQSRPFGFEFKSHFHWMNCEREEKAT
jgi:hypothetical protein